MSKNYKSFLLLFAISMLGIFTPFFIKPSIFKEFIPQKTQAASMAAKDTCCYPVLAVNYGDVSLIVKIVRCGKLGSIDNRVAKIFYLGLGVIDSCRLPLGDYQNIIDIPSDAYGEGSSIVKITEQTVSLNICGTTLHPNAVFGYIGKQPDCAKLQ